MFLFKQLFFKKSKSKLYSDILRQKLDKKIFVSKNPVIFEQK